MTIWTSETHVSPVYTHTAPTRFSYHEDGEISRPGMILQTIDELKIFIIPTHHHRP